MIVPRGAAQPVARGRVAVQARPQPLHLRAVAELARIGERLVHDVLLPVLARDGPSGARCPGCRLRPSHCLCALRPQVPTRAGVCLLMADTEALKPSNTGWLVADVVADTFAFGWARTEVHPGLRALLADPQWQPYLVFPGDYAEPQRVVTQVAPPAPSGEAPDRKPLFVLLDATWAEARRMFRKSP